MYDITSAKSLDRLDTWHKELDKYDSEEGMVSHSQPIIGHLTLLDFGLHNDP